MKKIRNSTILFIILTIGYLFLAHHLIYRKIFKADLRASDKEYSYMIGNNESLASTTILATLGDSLTAGTGVNNFKDAYPYLLAEKLSQANEKVLLRNFSYPGARTADLIENLLTPAIASQPDIITLLIGTNDMHGNVGRVTFQKNYQTILERLTKETKARIFLISIPFIGSDTLLLPPYDTYFNKETIAYNASIKYLAHKYNLRYIDIATPTEKVFEKDGDHYAADSFHPSAKGYALWTGIIYNGVRRLTN